MQIELPWNGRPFEAPVLAFDTETPMVDLTREVPPLVVMSVSDGTRTALVFPNSLEKFFDAHEEKEWVAWNIAFDFWVVRKGLLSVGDMFGVHRWVELAHRGMLHDAMLLEQLVRLGEGRDNEGFYARGLSKASSEYLARHLRSDKQEIRTTFTEDMARHPLDYDRGLWEYAAEDAQVTWHLWNELVRRGEQVLADLPLTVRPPESVSKVAGLLSEQIQVKAAIALAQITRNGMALDQDSVRGRVQEFTERCQESLATLDRIVPGIFQSTKKGRLLVTPKTGMPKLNYGKARGRLTKIALENGLKPPLTPKSKPENPTIGISADWWAIHSEVDPFVKAWCDYQEAVKTLQLLKTVEGKDEIHPQYRTLVRTGRTSANGPNIQQAPRDGWYRSLFVARPGYRLTAVDYSFIELRTLAQDMEYRYGHSTLADVIRSGVDPHVNTAALSLGMGLEDFQALKKTDPVRFKTARQAAKAVNFGIPGGLGKFKLRAYAKKNYGVDMTLEEASDLRQTLITKVYPELTRWLDDGLQVRLSASLGCTEQDVFDTFGPEQSPYLDPADHPMARLLSGHRYKKDGGKFSPFYEEEIWIGLAELIERSRELPPGWVEDDIWSRKTSPELAAYLFTIPSVTLTGRVRAETRYGEYRNTKFQGLAADGAKLALWNLTREGYRIVAFVHDEILVESPLTQEEKSVELAVSKIMSDSFGPVHPTGVPVGTACVSGAQWEKA